MYSVKNKMLVHHFSYKTIGYARKLTEKLAAALPKWGKVTLKLQLHSIVNDIREMSSVIRRIDEKPEQHTALYQVGDAYRKWAQPHLHCSHDCSHLRCNLCLQLQCTSQFGAFINIGTLFLQVNYNWKRTTIMFKVQYFDLLKCDIFCETIATTKNVNTALHPKGFSLN